jgi:hypothetical protein
LTFLTTFLVATTWRELREDADTARRAVKAFSDVEA